MTSPHVYLRVDFLWMPSLPAYLNEERIGVVDRVRDVSGLSELEGFASRVWEGVCCRGGMIVLDMRSAPTVGREGYIGVVMFIWCCSSCAVILLSFVREEAPDTICELPAVSNACRLENISMSDFY